MTDPIEHLAQRLRGLDAEPVHAHPGALDEVHRGLIGELERLAGVVSGDARSGGAGSQRSQR